ncbi:hypothetical protein VNO77_00415 [Canavalia gladiata]|uniref:Uncharacterized protein n=1 Tax=Canavalia gladiata TaxID=3824 RepID=A0AAN9R405_CANGL
MLNIRACLSYYFPLRLGTGEEGNGMILILRDMVDGYLRWWHLSLALSSIIYVGLAKLICMEIWILIWLT